MDSDDDCENELDSPPWSASDRSSVRKVESGYSVGPRMTKRMTVYQQKSLEVQNDLSDWYDKRGDDKNERFHHLQEHTNTLESRLEISTNVTAKKYTGMKDQLQIFEKEIAEETGRRQNLAHEADAAVAGFMASSKAMLETEQKARMAAEVNILTAFDDRSASLMREIRQAQNSGHENEGNLRRYLEEDVPRLYEALRAETESREAMEDRMMRKAMEEVAELQALVDTETKAREDAEEAMLRMLEDVVEKMQVELANERKERMNTQAMLETLLQQTCSKLQHTTSNL